MTSNKGQSTLEFLFTFAFAFSFIFLFLKVALNYTNGFLVHYATFMASRTYMVVDINSNTPSGSDNESEKRAQNVFQNNFNIFKFMPTINKKLKFNTPEDGSKKLYVGPYFDYKQKFSASPLIGGTTDVNFKSESFLGKEPTRAECLARVCFAMEQMGGTCSRHVTLADNGC